MLKCTGIAVLLSTALVLPVAAQWLNYPTPGIPRTADGKPKLSAPAPRLPDGKPDFSGLWHTRQADTGPTDKALHAIQAQPWAEDLSKKRKEDLGREDMSILCLPFGPRADREIEKIIQTPTMLVMLFNDLTYRQVFIDGRPLPNDPNPTWMGYSIGRWDADTLVIESAGYNDRTWLDSDGHPHTEALHVTERLRRPDFGHLELERTLVDPKALAQPLVIPMKFEFDADTDMLEYVCAENERDRSHLVGKASDDKTAAVKVAPEVLTRYVGVYELTVPERPHDPIALDVSMQGNDLALSMSGGPKYTLTALSNTKFYFEGAHLEFVVGGDKSPGYVLVQTVEGDFKAPRK